MLNRRDAETRGGAARGAGFTASPRRRVAASRFRFILPPSVFILSAMLLVFSGAATAMPLAEYRERLREAARSLGALAATEGEGGDAERARVFAEVRRALPATARVEHSGAGAEADNGWLHAALDRVARLPAADPARREGIARLAERLAALSDRVAEMEAPRGAAAAGDKEAEKGRLAAILRRPEYRQQDEAGGALRRLLDQFLKWLRDLFPEPEPLKPGTSRGLSTAAQVVVYALAVAVVGFVLWKFRGRLFRRDALRRVIPKREARVVLGEHVGAEETAADLLDEAERLARAGDLRGAIRKGYVALLCDLGDRKIIRLARHKTNRDYLDAVRRGAANQNLYATMKPLTDSFERHWYGLEPATAADWERFKSGVGSQESGVRRGAVN